MSSNRPLVSQTNQLDYDVIVVGTILKDVKLGPETTLNLSLGQPSKPTLESTTTNKNKRAESSTARQNKSGPNKQQQQQNNNKSNKTVHAPTAMSRQTKTGKPKITSSDRGDGSIRVRHREYLFDLTSTADFSVIPIEINPGLSIFAWLSALAGSYESYLFNNLSFDFESTAATTSTGTVMMAIDFDSADELPVNKQGLMAMQGAVRTAPWQAMKYSASSLNLKKFGVQRYVRLGALAPNLDIKTYDVGKLLLAVAGHPGALWGEVYVSYDITLFTPQAGPAPYDYNSANIFFNVNCTPTQPFGVSAQIKGNLPCRYKDGNTFRVDKIGEYLVNIRVDGTGLDDGESFTLNVADPVEGLIEVLDTLKSNATSTECVVLARLRVKTAGLYFMFSYGAATSISDVVLRISSYKYSLD